MAPDIFDRPVPRFRFCGMSDRLNEELLTSEGSHSSLCKPRLSRPYRKCSQGGMCMLVSEHRGGTVRMAWGRTGNQDEGDIWAWFWKTGGRLPVSVLGEMEAIRAKSEFTGGSLGHTGYFRLSSLPIKGTREERTVATEATRPDDQWLWTLMFTT